MFSPIPAVSLYALELVTQSAGVTIQKVSGPANRMGVKVMSKRMMVSVLRCLVLNSLRHVRLLMAIVARMMLPQM